MGGPLALSLDLLRTFLAVYRDGSFTGAARQLAVSQPTVTTQIKNLEATLGRPLFTRLARGVEPTPGAHLLARRIAEPLDQLDALTAGGLVEPVNPFTRTVHLGGPAELTTARVLPALAEMVAGGLRLRVVLGVADQLGQALGTGALDMAVTTVLPRRRGLQVHPLYDEEFVLVAAPACAERLPGDLADDGGRALADLPLISYAEDLPIVRRYWQTVFDARPRQQAAVVVGDLHAVQAAVIAGAGYSVLPRYLCADALHDGRLVVLHEPTLPPLNTVFLAARAAALTNPAVEAVHTHLLDVSQHWP
jgi:DNA-binding transcriptional LysR family regulator